MAITSTKKLFAKFNKYHKAVYLVLILVTIHSSMAQKVLSSLEYTFIVITCYIVGMIHRVLLLRKKLLQRNS